MEWGGAQIYFLGLMKKMRETSQVLALLPKGSSFQLLKFLDDAKISYEFLNTQSDVKTAPTLKRKIERHWNKLRSEFSLLKHLRKFDFSESVIHVELAPWQSMLALLWLCRKAQVFVTMHNSILPIPKGRSILWRVKFAILSRIDSFHIFASNEHAKKSLKGIVPREFYERIKVTYTNANPSEIDEALRAEIDEGELRTKFNLPPDKFLVFCVGQFIDRKGRWVFLEAARNLLNVNNDIAFVWISNSVTSNEDLAKIDDYNLGKNFILLKSETIGEGHADLFKLLRAADLFALPSYVEGLPISLLEAMALGIPSISTNVYAIPEAVKQLETGCLIEAGDADALSGAIQKLKDNDELRKKLSRNGRDFVLKNFSEPVVAEIAAREYAAALGNK